MSGSPVSWTDVWLAPSPTRSASSRPIAGIAPIAVTDATNFNDARPAAARARQFR
jgi:hypothetical protein